MNEMKAVYRLMLLVSAMFLIAMLLVLSLMVSQAEKDVRREVEAGFGFAEQLLRVAQYDPALLEPMLDGKTRHVKIEISGVSAPEQEAEEEEVPEWFQQLFVGAVEGLKPVRQLMPDRQHELVMTPDPLDEVEEVWESTIQTLLLFLLAAVLSNLAIFAGVRYAMKPIALFLEALDEIRQGRLSARLNNFSLPELQRIGQHFNNMADSLEKAQQQNRQLLAQQFELQEKERAHLARELHDDLGQYVTGIRAQAFMISHTAAENKLLTTTADSIVGHCDQMQQGFRQLVRSLHPVILEQLGLSGAIRTLVDQWQQSHGIECRLSITEPLPDLSDEQQTHIYRLLQEALHNVVQHADAERVEITLAANDNSLTVGVTDNGKGIEEYSQGLGLRSMKERAHILAARLQINSEPGAGVSVILTMPLKSQTAGVEL